MFFTISAGKTREVAIGMITSSAISPAENKYKAADVRNRFKEVSWYLWWRKQNWSQTRFCVEADNWCWQYVSWWQAMVCYMNLSPWHILWKHTCIDSKADMLEGNTFHFVGVFLCVCFFYHYTGIFSLRYSSLHVSVNIEC